MESGGGGWGTSGDGRLGKGGMGLGGGGGGGGLCNQAKMARDSRMCRALQPMTAHKRQKEMISNHLVFFCPRMLSGPYAKSKISKELEFFGQYLLLNPESDWKLPSK